MRLLWTAALAAVLFLPLSAADVAGVWKGAMETPMGPMETTITLQTGAELTGSVKTDFFESKIEKAKLEGGNISFEISMDFGKLGYEGTVAGDEMKLNVTAPDGAKIPLNCKRQK
jgi:opacity protein-like surface antigen